MKAIEAGGALAFAVEHEEPAVATEEEEKEEEAPDAQMSFMGGMAMAIAAPPEPTSRRVAISAAAGTATIVKLDSGDAAEKLRSLLKRSDVPIAVHDYKAAIHALDPLGIQLKGFVMIRCCTPTCWIRRTRRIGWRMLRCGGST